MRSVLAFGFRQALFGSLALVAIAGCTSTSPETETGATPEAEQDSLPILVDGSSTVFPITDEVLKEYEFEKGEPANIQIAVSGTTGGFRRFCSGETQISNASRPILASEMEACRAAGVEYIELPVAYDALTVVVPIENDWLEEITVDELKQLWEPDAEGSVTTWSQIRPEWPDQAFTLYGPGEDSGTFDYFTEAIVGESRASRTDYIASEDDEELVRGVRRDPNGLAYFGYAYYEESANTLRAVSIDSGEGAVSPSAEAVINAEYQPLARPLFIYVNAAAAQENPALMEFVNYYLSNAAFLVRDVGYIPLPTEAYSIAGEHFANNRVGTVFAGEAETNLTIEELLEREAQF